MDIIAQINGVENCNIELQIVNKDNIIERILYYWSKLYSRQIKSGNDYTLLEKTIIILIADFELENLKELDYHSIWKIMESKGTKKIVLTEKLELDIIELPKIIGKEKIQDNLLDWLYFLENPKSERVTKKMKENEELKEAVEKLDTLSEDERMQRIADLRQKAIMDEKAIYRKGVKDSIKEVARKMLEKNINISDIIEITGLNMEEIKKLS